MEKLPKYASELIAWLDEEVGSITLDNLGVDAWGDMDSGNVRRMAYWAGQRALVDALVSMLEEQSGDKNTDDSESSVLSVIRGPDGKIRRGEPPVHMAPDLPSSGDELPDGDDEG